MAAVPTSLLDELTDEVNALSADAQAKVRPALESLLSSWERGGGGDVAALRERAYETIEAVLGYYADTCAAARAAEYYDAVRASQGFPGKYRAVAESMRDPDATLGAVRYFIGKVVEGAPEVFVSRCVTRVDEEIRRAANRCVAHNARKDPAKPWYARVPRGETCGFCLMLASFGFYAKTEEAAEHSHAHCDCRIVPGFDGVTTVKGYDPDGMYERYNDCLAALGGRDGIVSDWYAMPEDEREALVRRHGNKEGKAYTAYLNNRVASEIELRDPSWYAGGEHKGITFTDDAVRRDKVKRWRVDPGERRTAEKLAALGYKTEFWEDEVHLKSENAQGKTTVSHADLSTGIEIKTVYTSKSENTFKSHMKSVANKSGVRFAVFDVSENKSVTDSQAEAWIRKYMKRYGISEVRMLGHDGSLQTIKNRRGLHVSIGESNSFRLIPSYRMAAHGRLFSCRKTPNRPNLTPVGHCRATGPHGPKRTSKGFGRTAGPTGRTVRERTRHGRRDQHGAHGRYGADRGRGARLQGALRGREGALPQVGEAGQGQ